ncbi:hypothetical protein [Bifidobacterium tibiigranuli]|jgi:hypothetical protein|uniref:hypothetical protein n=1 Tax=Bifidobacterium tibiigranuli TaxID=2172043 RepID=UPI0026F1891B|nr:hypothetical protein [Bifidobacterium tibiigranuli]MCI1673434.1 hypothetical protein [Bifidobacterium tibiigranuli]MCI1712734.1 hypothetical protein [Bifidobacterium tibiigranuli]MCI2185377.1 hypothetical protein [Bifidobacterium tibiigranuli]MCI2203648.1 hypothetical protein [Bifidobacterium tibiigranuli]
MPWWIWLLLALFMLAMLLIGAAYVVVHGLRAFHVVADMGSTVSDKLSAAGEGEGPEPDEPPLFTQPLRHAQERYAEAHADVVRRRMRAHDRHADQWAQWRQFNE